MASIETKYVTSDGSQFDTPKEAVIHMKDFEGVLIDELVEELVPHRTLDKISRALTELTSEEYVVESYTVKTELQWEILSRSVEKDDYYREETDNGDGGEYIIVRNGFGDWGYLMRGVNFRSMLTKLLEDALSEIKETN